MNDVTITLLFLAFTIILYVTEKIPLALTSMIVCVGLNLTGVLTIKEAFEGFVNGNVILFVAMFIVGGALFETGMASDIGGIITKFAKTEKQLIIAIMVIVGMLSGVLSNTGTAAVLIPVVVGVAAKSGFARSKLLMPLVFAAALGGNLSLIGAPGNMIANTALESVNMSFGFFEYAKIGLPMLIVAIIFYSTIGFKLLPNHKADEKELAYNENDIAYFFDCGGRNLKQVYEYIEEHKLNLKYIILTHGHGDHIEGLNDLASHYPEAKVYIGEEDKDFLYNSELSLSAAIFGEVFKFKGELITVKEGDIIGDFKVIDTPGHTIGSKSFYDEKDKILMSGDTLFRRSYGRYDLPTGNLNMLCNSLQKLSKLPDETIVYNGHTDNTTIGEEKRFLEKLGIL